MSLESLFSCPNNHAQNPAQKAVFISSKLK